MNVWYDGNETFETFFSLSRKPLSAGTMPALSVFPVLFIYISLIFENADTLFMPGFASC